MAVHETREPPHRLVLIRHGRAEQAGTTDFDRPLAPAGADDAAEAGFWLAAAGIVADAALVSAAARTRATWATLATAAGWQVEATLDRGLYTADPDTALDQVRLTPESSATLVVVGHNPTVASLAQLLDDGEGDAAASVEMMLGFPPGSVAVFEYDGPWAALEWATARLTAYHAGRR